MAGWCRAVGLCSLVIFQLLETTLQSSNILTNLAKSDGRNPLVVLVKDGRNTPLKYVNINGDKRIRDESSDDDDDDYDEADEKDVKDEAKTVFLNYLRTSPDEKRDPILHQSKDILRSALRARCVKVTTCIRECVYVPSCVVNCQIVFDRLNLCEPPRVVCKRPKCGRTMPPHWRL